MTVDRSAGTDNFNSPAVHGGTLKIVSGPVIVNLACQAGGGRDHGDNDDAVLTLEGGAVENALNPSELQILYAGTRGIRLSAGSEAALVVYAPNAPVEIHGGGDRDAAGISGTIVGARIDVDGGVAIHYDRELGTVGLPVNGGDAATPLPPASSAPAPDSDNNTHDDRGRHSRGFSAVTVPYPRAVCGAAPCGRGVAPRPSIMRRLRGSIMKLRW